MRAGSAWDDAATRGVWKRGRRVYRIWMLVGIAGVIGFTAYAAHVQDHAEELRSSGVHVKGTVLEDPPFALRCGQVPVSVRFEVDSRDVMYPFYVDGCSGNGLHGGETVDVYYSRADPSDFAVNGNASEGPVAVGAAIVALVVGAFFLGGAGVRAVRGHRVRRLLQASDWQSRKAVVRDYKWGWMRGRRVVALIDESPRLLFVTQPMNADRALPRVDQTVLVAGRNGEMCVVKAATSSRLVFARRPRSARALRHALSAVGWTATNSASNDGPADQAAP